MAGGLLDRHHARIRLAEKFGAQSGATVDSSRIQRLLLHVLQADEFWRCPGVPAKEGADFDANRATATSPELVQYRFVHSRAWRSQQRAPELSGIVLSLVNREGTQQDVSWAHEYLTALPADLVSWRMQNRIGKEIKGEGLSVLRGAYVRRRGARCSQSLGHLRRGVGGANDTILQGDAWQRKFNSRCRSPNGADRDRQRSAGRLRTMGGFVLQGEVNNSNGPATTIRSSNR